MPRLEAEGRLRTTMTRLALLALIGSALMLGGCQSMPLLGWAQDESEATVMPLWETYKECRASGDLMVKQLAARHLATAARLASERAPSPIPLPQFLKVHVAQRSPRYSVDPNALSASCSLAAGEAALRAGEHGVAADLFRFVLTNYSRSEYEYYAEEAWRGLQRVELTRLVSAPAESLLRPVLSTP